MSSVRENKEGKHRFVRDKAKYSLLTILPYSGLPYGVFRFPKNVQYKVFKCRGTIEGLV